MIHVTIQDSIIDTRYTDKNGFCTFNRVAPGTYGLQLKKQGFVTQAHLGLIIMQDSITSLQIEVYTPQEVLAPKNNDRAFEFGTISLKGKHPLYSPATDTAFKASYSFSIMSGTLTGSAYNFCQAGILQGFSVSQHFLKNSSELRPYSIDGRERYSAVNYHITLITRLNITRNKPEEDLPGVFFDAGAGYALPVWVRHVTLKGNTRITNKRIHRFTETYAFARIGYGKVALSAQYYLTDFLKTPYPEPPVFLVGLDLFINAGS